MNINPIITRDGHFWQFLISIIDRFKKRLIEYSGGQGMCEVRGMAVMEITKIEIDILKKKHLKKNSCLR